MSDHKGYEEAGSGWLAVVSALFLMVTVALAGILISHWQAAVAGRAASARWITECLDRSCSGVEVAAQVRAAGAAELTADLSFWSLAVSALGLSLLGATLYANMRSTRAAIHAAAAAQASVSVAERTAKQQLRAYVVLELCSVKDLEDRKVPTFAVQIHNVGQTPALRLRITTEVYVLHDGLHSVPIPELSGIEGPGADLGAGRSRQHSRLARVTVADGGKQAFNDRKFNFLFVGICRYTDIFGDDHATTFAHVYDRGDINGRYYEHGNSIS